MIYLIPEIPCITELLKKDISGKVVYLRGSADVPMKNDKDIYDPEKIKDPARIESIIPTLEFLIRAKARIVMQPGWIDRPDGVQKEASVIPVFLYIKKKLDGMGLLKHEPMISPTELYGEVRSVHDNMDMVRKAVSELKPGQILMLENPRFDEGYNKGDKSIAKELAEIVDMYVADDFAQRHRPASDIIHMPKLLPSYAGIHLMKEIESVYKISRELDRKDRRPFVFILAGKKIETKPGIVSKMTVALNLIDRMIKGDKILVGGAVAYTFMIAQRYLNRAVGGPKMAKKISKDGMKNIIGESYVEWEQIYDQIAIAGNVLVKAKQKKVDVIIPKDHTIMSEAGEIKKNQKEIPSGWKAVDIGGETVKEFNNIIESAGFVVMSGPVGMFDKGNIKGAGAGSVAIAKKMAEATKNRGTVTVSAGGESTFLINHTGVKISHASIGGGSTLEFIEKGSLPGIDVLKK